MCSSTLPSESANASVYDDETVAESRQSSTNSRLLIEETDNKFFFPPGSLRTGQDNVLTIVQDNMGLNETGSESLRLQKRVDNALNVSKPVSRLQNHLEASEASCWIPANSASGKFKESLVDIQSA